MWRVLKRLAKFKRGAQWVLREVTRTKRHVDRRARIKWLAKDAAYYGEYCITLWLMLMRGDEIRVVFGPNSRGVESELFEGESEDGDRHIIENYRPPHPWGSHQTTSIRRKGETVLFKFNDVVVLDAREPRVRRENRPPGTV
jgi:hypothetical protein